MIRDTLRNGVDCGKSQSYAVDKSAAATQQQPKLYETVNPV